MEFIDFVVMLTVYFATGIYAWKLFRDNPRIPTFCYVWLASVVILLSGAIYHQITGIRASYVDGPGVIHWLTWREYGNAMLAATVGIVSITLGHHWAVRREWQTPIPEFIDSRALDAEHLGRWALLLLLGGFIPLAATGILNPITLLGALVHGRALHGMAVYLYSAGTYFSFFNLFATLVPFGAAATAILLWGGRRPAMLLTITAFLALLLFLSGTRSSAAAILAPFVVIPRYMGNQKLFRKLAAIGIIGGFVLFSVQLVYRSVGFEKVQLGRALTKAAPLQVVDGNQLSWTGQAMRDYGNLFPSLDGSSYLAVVVGPFPRIFWHSKPDGYSKVNADNLDYPFGTTMTSGWMGEAYANFGWFGIPIVGLIAGVLMGILDVFIRRSGAFAMAVFLPLQMRWGFWVRGDSVFSLDAWMFGFLVLILLLAIFGPATSRATLAGAAPGADSIA